MNSIDPLGLDVFLFFWSSVQTNARVGHIATGIGSKVNMTVYDPYPTGENHTNYKYPLVYQGNFQFINKNFHNKVPPALILQLKTDISTDEAVNDSILNFIIANEHTWAAENSNCADVAKEGLRSTDFNPGTAVIISTPQELSQDLYENNKTRLSDISVIQGDWESYRNSTGAINGVIQRYITK